MLSPKAFFFTFKKEILLQYTVDNKVCAFLARLKFFEKLLIGRETRVRLSVLTDLQIKRVEFREKA